MTAVATVPSHPDALPRFPVGHIGAHRIENPDNLVPRHAPGKAPIFVKESL
jgi:hypothetical protein